MPIFDFRCDSCNKICEILILDCDEVVMCLDCDIVMNKLPPSVSKSKNWSNWNNSNTHKSL